MKSIFRIVLLSVLAITLFKGFSTQEWQSLIIIIAVSGFLLLTSFSTKTAKSNRGSSNHTDSSATYNDNSCDGGDSGGGCD
jgi:hypothetical protein